MQLLINIFTGYISGSGCFSFEVSLSIGYNKKSVSYIEGVEYYQQDFRGNYAFVFWISLALFHCQIIQIQDSQGKEFIFSNRSAAGLYKRNHK
jgi:hypothetical protein